MMTQVEQLRSLLNDSGLFAGFTDINSVAQPAPSVELEYLDEAKLAKYQDRRFVYLGKLSNNNSPTPSLYDDREMIIVVFGKGGTQSSIDRRIVANYAEQINKYLLDNYQKDCMYAITPKGVSGIFRNGDGRFVYEIRVRARFNV